ncbi:Protein of unknown function (DUF2808) [Xenococcus sp. PCC 7305]|uniref:DUF2808 domain-containing protein n=1 Tax=Xenococcus sp. PCC 7305 TaxID=102125 RepID=UPI0002AC2613|nr:DUF2808 domain-containing protein [Xenococcus sp. PCC 7305]ELS01984.1 Protein of unknown function (DUF2808) [Xenococcus sp. PCC 7305]
MLKNKLNFKRLFSSLALSSCLLGGVATISFAQGNSGLTIFSGVGRENILDYYLDFGGKANARDRYRLRVPGKKLIGGASKFFIAYPDYYDGKFDVDKIEVRIKKGKKQESLALREVIWDKESYIIEIDLEEPLKESKKVEIVFSNVKNPEIGTYYFHCQVLPADDLPIRQHLGTWILSIDP